MHRPKAGLTYQEQTTDGIVGFPFLENEAAMHRPPMALLAFVLQNIVLQTPNGIVGLGVLKNDLQCAARL